MLSHKKKKKKKQQQQQKQCKIPLSYSLGFGSLLCPCPCSGLHFSNWGQGKRNHYDCWNNCGRVSCYLRRLGCHLSALGSSYTRLGDNWLGLLRFGKSNGAWLFVQLVQIGQEQQCWILARVSQQSSLELEQRY